MGKRVTWTVWITNVGSYTAFDVVITGRVGGTTFTEPVASAGSDGTNPAERWIGHFLDTARFAACQRQRRVVGHGERRGI